jgi:rhodanese-related sulfurtransferase
VEHWYAEDYEEAAQNGLLLDVRSPREYAGWHIPGALNVPVTELRQRMDEVQQRANGQPVYAYCLSGFRSYVAARALHQAGVPRVATLSGGIKTFVAYHRNPQVSGRPGVPFEPYAEQALAEADALPVA